MMNETSKRNALTTAAWVNPIIVATFLVVNTLGQYTLGWEKDTIYFVFWFTLFMAVVALVNYYLFLRWDKPEKTTQQT